MSRPASPFAARLGAALGLEPKDAARVVDQLARCLPAWLPLADADDVALMFASLRGFETAGRTPDELAGALERARIVIRTENGGNFEPSEAFQERIDAETDRKTAERERKRAESAQKVLDNLRERAETVQNVPESDVRLARTRARTTTTTTPTPPPADASTDDRVGWVLWHAAHYGYGAHNVSRDLLDWLLELFDFDPERTAEDIAVAFRAQDGFRGNRRGYIEGTIRRRFESRQRDAEHLERGPPAEADPYDELDIEPTPPNVRFIEDRRLQ